MNPNHHDNTDLLTLYYSAPIKGVAVEQMEQERQCVRFLQSYGKVLTEHLWDEALHLALELGQYPKGYEHLASPAGTFAKDIEWVLESDLVIAHVDRASTGVGIEIATAYLNHIPVWCCYQQDNEISWMVSGNPNVKLIPYRDHQDLLTKLHDALEKFRRTTLLGRELFEQTVGQGRDITWESLPQTQRQCWQERARKITRHYHHEQQYRSLMQNYIMAGRSGRQPAAVVVGEAVTPAVGND